MFAAPLEVLFRMLFMSALVRKVPFLNEKRGPLRVGCIAQYARRACTGHKSVLLACSLIVTPCLNGSVLDVFMCTVAE